MFMASRKQTLEREYQTYTIRPLSISTTTKPKLSYQVLGEHHKDRAEERAARSDAKVRQIFSDNCSCCNPSPFHNYCQHPAPSGQQCNALTQHRLLRCNSLNIFRLPCWSPSWEGWTRPWKVFQIKVSQLPCNNFRIAKEKVHNSTLQAMRMEREKKILRRRSRMSRRDSEMLRWLFAVI